MSKIAHTEKDVKKRREVFEENWKIFAGSLYNEEMIRNKIFTHIGYGSFGRYYGKLKNPLFGYENGSFVYANIIYQLAKQIKVYFQKIFNIL